MLDTTVVLLLHDESCTLSDTGSSVFMDTYDIHGEGRLFCLLSQNVYLEKGTEAVIQPSIVLVQLLQVWWFSSRFAYFGTPAHDR